MTILFRKIQMTDMEKLALTIRSRFKGERGARWVCFCKLSRLTELGPLDRRSVALLRQLVTKAFGGSARQNYRSLGPDQLLKTRKF